MLFNVENSVKLKIYMDQLQQKPFFGDLLYTLH